MTSYVGWTLAAIMVLAGFVLMLFVPGVGVLATIALAVGIVMAAVLAISRGASRGHMTSDVEERRAEHEERRKARHAGRRRAR